MKLIHLSDLHLGKRFREKSLIEDQRHILSQILKITEEEKPDGVIIAGDIYDRPVPPVEAVLLLDDFLVRLSEACRNIFIISGNHDSAERLSFGSRLMDKSGVHVASVYEGSMKRVVLEDGSGPVNIWMLPFVRPIHVKAFFEEVDRGDYTGALKKVIEAEEINREERNLLIAHQFVTGAVRSESEDIPVGGLDSVDGEVFRDFDYVALGHLHRAQAVGRIRYCGTPLKYSFSEADDEKSVLVVELGNKSADTEGGESVLSVRTRPLLPLHEVRIRRGSFDELMNEAAHLAEEEKTAFLRAELTDEEYIPDGIQRLRSAYPNVLEVRYPNVEKESEEVFETSASEERSPVEYLEDFFETMRGRPMNEEQRSFAEEMIRRVWEEEE